MIKSEIELKAEFVYDKYILKGGAFKKFDKIFIGENIKYKEIEDTKLNFLGVYTKATNGQKYIMINSTINNEGRKNFTLAHELGHYFLNHKLSTSNFIDEQISEDCINKEPMEFEADYFASCLLMPKQKIIKAFKSMLFNAKGVTNNNYLMVNKHNFGTWKHICNELIKRYGVSETALRYRLKSLQLLSINLD